MTEHYLDGLLGSAAFPQGGRKGAALGFEALDQGPERFGLAVQSPHGFGVAGVQSPHGFGVTGIFPLLTLISGSAHLPDALPDKRHPRDSDHELPDSYPFGWCHRESLLAGCFR